MFRILQVLVLSCALASYASAMPLSLTAHAGCSVPNLRDHGGSEFSSGWSSRLGGFFGVGAAMPIAGPWSVTAEVNYSAQGGKKDGLQAFSLPPGIADVPDPVYGSFKNTAKLDYVEIPVLARLEVAPLHHSFVQFGPYVGFLLSAKNVTEGLGPVFLDAAGTEPLGIPIDFGATTDNKSSLHAYNWGLQAGLGARQPLGAGAVTLEVRGELGLMNLQKHPDVDGRNSTGALIAALGYEFPLAGAR
jgi:hypothetical protein